MTFFCRKWTNAEAVPAASSSLAIPTPTPYERAMSIWFRLGDLVSRVTATASAGIVELVEAVRTIYAGDPALRRKVAFSVAMIALSAKMAKSDGIVTQDEVRAFHEIFEAPQEELRNVARLYQLATGDIAGFETYAERIAGLCGSGRANCAMLEDILDGLFHIARADGVVHEREVAYLRRVADIFGIDDAHFERILARHAHVGDADPYAVLGVRRGEPFETIRARYRRLIAANHPDKLVARGVPEEFVAIATSRVAAINAAYEAIERGRRRA